MATVEECEAALRALAARLGDLDQETKGRMVHDRTLACTIPDLDTTFRGWLRDGALHDIEQGSPDGAQVKLRVSSDDLVALVAGRLSFPQAWLTGRLKVSASIGDMLLLRGML